MIQLVPALPMTERGFPCNIVSSDSERVVYGTGSSVVIRTGSTDCNLVNHHQYRVTAVAISPSGSWIASGDNRGNVKIWVSRGEFLLKYEYTLLSSTVRGLAWSPDSKRIAVCGGEQSKGGEAVCVAFDTGARLGEISGHSKCITCIAYRPKAPYRIISGGEDSNVIFHEGPPFKFFKSHQSVHTSFVNAVAFTSDGMQAFSCASDGLVAMYEGDSGELLSVLSPKLPCSIWGLAPLSSTCVVIACGDKKIRCIADMKIVQESSVGNAKLQDTPMGIAASQQSIVTTSLDGSLRLWSHSLVLEQSWCGSQGAITAIVPLQSGFMICSAEGAVWLLEGDSTRALNLPKPIKGTAGLYQDASHLTYGVSAQNDSQLIALESEASIQTSTSGITLLASSMALADKGKVLLDIASNVITDTREETITCFASDGHNLAIVYEKNRSNNLSLQSENRIVEVYRGKDQFVVSTEITTADIVCVAIQGDRLAVASANHELHVYEFNGSVYAPIILTIRCWTYHKARIHCMRWTQDSRFLVSAGLDKQVIVWDVLNPSDGPVTQLKDLHREGISSICLVQSKPTDLTIVTGGIEGSVRVHLCTLSI